MRFEETRRPIVGGSVWVLVVIAVVVSLFAAWVGAQTVAAPAVPQAAAPVPAKDAAAPVLSETDRLKVVNASLAVENWTLKVQASVTELQKARAEFDRIVGVVTPAGWRLTENLEFVKVDKPKGGG